ncbi:hypothetical protein SAMN05192560_0912 [Methylobacillus rhizosphaerae]|uniref:2,4-dihydroxyhept-2-ene-1,7-dioic acid aldolase n=1 Tax=Methylobacillus rhizosphaerae TaxID=551994 RepID=A0A238YYI0_9PROT|nr:DUF2218 domain-containing protein [Methylobacillus rhizosphaerae]SNR75734.1 hypothetical protein SAMN05192560_0912 [Methylobacillus rhizosphaerae]
MHYLKGSLPTHEPSRYLMGLCSHFRRKIEVEYDENRGLARFPWGNCTLQVANGALDLECEAATPEQLGRVQYVLDEHIALFSRRAPMTVVWQKPKIRQS